MPDRTMKRHDTADPITGTASDADGPVDLTQFDTVTFMAKIVDGPTIFEGEASYVTDGTDGKWKYEQVDADVSVANTYKCELECVRLDGKKVHFPSTEAANPELLIEPDLDNA